MIPGIVASAQTGSGDPNYLSRTLISNFSVDGDAIDHSSYAATITKVGTPTFNADGVNLNGSTQYLSLADAARWQNGIDFGIEIKGVKTTIGAGQYLIAQRTGGHPFWILQVTTGGLVQFFLSLDGGGTVGTFVGSSTSISTGVPVDIAISRSGPSGNVSVWFDGVNVTAGGATQTASAYPDVSALLTIGASGTPDSFTTGSIKGMRITNGATISPASMAYPFQTS